jgi:3'-phosphoadenosine 5'-phosphosulfate sulfotransferase (PAPS reductase)/FAD synthetase
MFTGAVSVCFNGGKDCIVMLHLVHAYFQVTFRLHCNVALSTRILLRHFFVYIFFVNKFYSCIWVFARPQASFGMVIISSIQKLWAGG